MRLRQMPDGVGGIAMVMRVAAEPLGCSKPVVTRARRQIRVEQHSGGDVPRHRDDDRRFGIEPAQPRLNIAAHLGCHQIGLGQHQPVGQRDLLCRFIMRVEGGERVRRVDRGDDTIQRDQIAQPYLLHQQRHDRRRIGKAGGLDGDAPIGRDRARPATLVQRLDGIDQIAAHGAADAAAFQQHRILEGGLDQQMIEADLAEFVDDHRGVGHAGMLEQPVQQRRLAAAEKASDERRRYRWGRHEVSWDQGIRSLKEI